jgi:hypothetical protein
MLPRIGVGMPLALDLGLEGRHRIADAFAAGIVPIFRVLELDFYNHQRGVIFAFGKQGAPGFRPEAADERCIS